MKPIHTTSYDAHKCAEALMVADSVVLDLETTGIRRHDQIVATGLLIDRDAHILITNEHRDLSSTKIRITPESLRVALAPIGIRSDLQIVVHNAAFDVGMLERAGVRVNCRVLDTMKLLKLDDSDRGRAFDASESGSQTPRTHRTTGAQLNYKLKDLARHVLHVRALDFPGNVVTQPLSQLVEYLKSDLVVTSMLHQQLSRTLAPECIDYHQRLGSCITTQLVRMSNTGIEADPNFINQESLRLLELMRQISLEHYDRFGQRLDVGDWHLKKWIYFSGLRCRIIPTGKKHLPSLRSQDLLVLRSESFSLSIKRSLELIHDYKQLQSLMTRLRSLSKHVCTQTRRIYSTFNDTQSSGRVSSTHPNLQQIASTLATGARKQLVSESFRDVTVKSRNAIRASEGHSLVACDIAQADIRVLAHVVENFGMDGRQHLQSLLAERELRIGPRIEPFRAASREYLQPHNRKVQRCPKCWSELREMISEYPYVTCPRCNAAVLSSSQIPHFDPSEPCRLADDFRNSGGDFYTTATRRMLGRDPRDKTERNHMKQTILGIVNGMSAHALAKRLEVDLELAKGYLDAFAAAYPQVDAYKSLSKFEFAITGRSWTFAGHHRRITPHYWMVNEPEIELFVSYRGADKLWLRVVPLRPNRHTLRCWVLSAVDAKYGSKNEGLEIFHHEDGRISSAPYRFFNDAKLIYRLPVRNISWRLIRRVRTKTEEAVYDGYDKTWRQLFNHVAQGGTADIAKIMMLRSQSVCERFDARLLLQIHDELVFEVSDDQLTEFVSSITRVLTLPPCDNFRVPIVVEPKVGKRFGELKELSPSGA